MKFSALTDTDKFRSGVIGIIIVNITLVRRGYDYLGLLCCFIVLLCVSVVSRPYVIYFPTAMARCSLFMLKVQTNKQFTTLVCKKVNQSINPNLYSGLSGNRHCKDH